MSSGDFVRYSLIVVGMIIFVILYVWQNIEVMKLKMYYNKSVLYKQELVKKHDRLIYEIERYRRFDLIDAYAEQQGMRRMRKEDAVRIKVDEASSLHKDTD